MNGRTNSHNYARIYLAVRDALNTTFSNLSIFEPQMVADMAVLIPRIVEDMAIHIPLHINRTSLKGGLSLRTSCVFIHQQPFVECDSFPSLTPQSVELGDILFLRTGINRGKVVDRRAMLIQVKKTDDFNKAPDNINQYHLYSQWPPFRYTRASSALKNKPRHITGPDIYCGAKYLLIGNDASYIGNCGNFCCSHQLCLPTYAITAMPSTPYGASRFYWSNCQCFITELVDFILGIAGKTFRNPPPPSSRNWDRVIEDLVKVTAIKYSKYIERAGGIGGQRGQGELRLTGYLSDMSMMQKMGFRRTDNEIDREGIPPREAKTLEDDSERGGISIMEFVVNRE
jgi:hypothetical protein